MSEESIGAPAVRIRPLPLRGVLKVGEAADIWHKAALSAPVAFGVPALVWGTHMRSRRRQGWWVCLFGVALTAPVASTFLNPDVGLVEAALSVVYSILIGLVIAFIIIRIDLALTGSTAAGSGRRAAREADEASAVRPEPGRTHALL